MALLRALFNVRGALFTSALLLTTAAAPALASPVHVTEAETLLTDLSVSKQNVYGSSPTYIKWNGLSSQARTVCGTFVTNLLLHSYSWTPSTFTQWMGTTSPYAETYYAAILAQNNFTHINNIQQVQPGDIIAIKYYNSSVTGHAMLVDSVAKAESAQAPVISGTTQYSLTVIDSSSLNHGPNDTRVTDPSTTHNGIGKGDIRVYVDASLQPVGYTWANQPSSNYYSMSQRPLAIGRIKLANLGVKTAAQQTANGISPVTGEIVVQEQGLTSGKTDDDTLAAPQTNEAGVTDEAQLGGCSLSAHAGLTSPAALMALLFLCFVGLRWRRRHGATSQGQVVLARYRSY